MQSLGLPSLARRAGILASPGIKSYTDKVPLSLIAIDIFAYMMSSDCKNELAK